MSYIPHTDKERHTMLSAIGIKQIEDLYEAIPKEVRFPDLNIPTPLSELEVAKRAFECRMRQSL
jgi:glycine dehydrogenase subunit 1